MQLTCLKCGHKWESRIKHPQCCPRCKSYTWNKERKIKKEGNNEKDN
jgi:predicted Zn-ribbon and HTH transcriptional regulator